MTIDLHCAGCGAITSIPPLCGSCFAVLGLDVRNTRELRDHEPSRRGLEHASGLLPVDHPQFWSGAQLVAAATRNYYRNH